MYSDTEELPPLSAYDLPYDAPDKLPEDLSYLQKLNDSQRQAVEHIDGALLVLAGAGTGKTTVLTTRIAHILNQQKAFANNILAVTFTNKAAREMEQRIAGIVGGVSAGLWLGTFHSICLKIIRRHTELVGLKPYFTIINQDDQVRLVKQILKENHIDDKRFPAKAVVASINSFKDKAITAAKAQNESAAMETKKIYEIYQNRLLSLNAVDFGDLLLTCINLLNRNSDILEMYQNRFKYILVDEYQDTNIAQYMWLRLLAEGNSNICCVGDDDQSIYGWRGAEIENILRFEKDFPNATTIRLENNYRSTPEILAVADSLINNNKNRLGKSLKSQIEKGNKVNVVSLWDERAEASFIGNIIEDISLTKRHPMNETAILVRAGFQTRAFEECFISMGISYRVIGGLRFYERMEIRDAIAYIRLSVNPSDDLSFERIINTPKRGIGAATVGKIRIFARENSISMTKAADIMLEQKIFKGKGATALTNLLNSLKLWGAQMVDKPHFEVVDNIIHESGYLEMYRQEKTAEAEGRVENLRELIGALKEFENIEQFLEHVSLVVDGVEVDEENMVNIMTMHGAKGLEFETVFLTGWEEGLFPSQKSMDEKGETGLEEERRLAYVGITRAKRNLFITFVSSRFQYGQYISNLPSRFIDELPQEYIEITNTGTNYGNQRKRRSSPPLEGGARGGGQYNTPNPLPKGEGTASVQKSARGFEMSERIFHQKFGYGRIINMSGSHMKIAFEKSGIKTLLEDYIEKVG